MVIFNHIRTCIKLPGKNFYEHYAHYKEDRIDKTYLPMYFYLEQVPDSRDMLLNLPLPLEMPLCSTPKNGLHSELEKRMKSAFVFNISFENGTLLTEDDMSNPWNAIGLRIRLAINQSINPRSPNLIDWIFRTLWIELID